MGGDAETHDELRREMQRKVSDAYSECAAFYGMVAADRELTDQLTAEEAAAMKAEASMRAMAHAVDVEEASEALRRVSDTTVRAKAELIELAKGDVAAFTKSIDKSRKSCRMAVNDPSVFVDRLLRSERKKTRYLKLPPNLTYEMILKEGKPAAETMDMSKCTKPAVAHKLPLDDVLVESGMICAAHVNGVCDGERSWMSYRQFIEERYPDQELDGYTEKLSVTFKGGKTQQVRELIACVVAPEFRT